MNVSLRLTTNVLNYV